MKILNMLGKRSPLIIAIIAFIILPFIIGSYYTRIATEFMILAMFATSYALLLGYGGLLSLGHGALFAVGSYTVALLTVKAGIPIEIAIVCGPIISAILSFLIATLAVRLGPIYFAMLTLAFGEIIRLLATNWYSITNGDNGIVGFGRISLFSTTINFYYFVFFCVLICLALMWIIIKSPFTKLLEGTRDNALRIQFLGTNIRFHQVIAFTISGFFTGFAGVLYALLHDGAFPAYAGLMNTVGPLFMCIIGGMYNFFGGIVGAVILTVLQRILVEHIEYWPAIMGVSFIIFMLIFPEGIMGLIQEKFGKNREKAELGQYDIPGN